MRIKLIVFIMFMGFISPQVFGSDITWKEAQVKKNGTLTIYYASTKPFLIKDADGSLKGLEYEMMVGFKYFLLNKYGIKIDLNWQPQNSFKYVFGLIKDNPKNGEFGLDIVSHTDQRAEIVGFSEPYFPDIQVMISNKAIPTVYTIEQFIEQFDNLVAVSIQGTTYDQYLQKIKADFDLDFEIIYKNVSPDVLIDIQKNQNYFGYMDLPNYLLSLNQKAAIKRQPILPIRGKGYCIIFKKGSDWSIPINEYLNSSEYDALRKKGISKYLGDDVFDLIKHMSKGTDEEMMLLQKEKDVVEKELTQRAKQIERQSYVTNMLMACVVLIMIVTFALFNRNRVKSKANEILTMHRNLIENQNNLLTKRNNELLDLDEEKNNFINILSHDLRAPINNIKGLAGVLKLDDNLSESQIKMIDHITAESGRLNKMVTRILDVERIESKSTDDFHKIKLKGVLEKVLANYEQQALDKKITLALDTEGEEQKVNGLDQYLFHIFENLLSNAVKFSPLGEAIWLKVETHGDWQHISFTDGGPGLSEADQKMMFKKFQRLSAKPTAGERSTGLGLSIVEKYTDLLNGQLECQSEPDQGTTFIVKLRVA